MLHGVTVHQTVLPHRHVIATYALPSLRRMRTTEKRRALMKENSMDERNFKDFMAAARRYLLGESVRHLDW